MTLQFNPPPGWPVPAPGWRPDADWTPPQDWPAAPPGWEFWRDVPAPPTEPVARRTVLAAAREARPAAAPARRVWTLWTPRSRGPLVAGGVVLAAVSALLVAGRLGSRPPDVALEQVPRAAPATEPTSLAEPLPPPGRSASSTSSTTSTTAPGQARRETGTWAAARGVAAGRESSAGVRPTSTSTTATRSAVTEVASSSGGSAVLVRQSTSVATSTSTRGTSTSTAAPDGVTYRNCEQARRDGATPLIIGMPGYRPDLDRDGDGIACE